MNDFSSMNGPAITKALVMRELRGRYKASVLGVLWSIFTPLFMALIYVFFLRLLMGRGVPIEAIIIGVFGWQFTMHCLNGGMTAVTGSGNIIKKVPFPRIALPSAVMLAGLVDWFIAFGVQLLLVGWILFQGGDFFPWTTVLVPVVLAFHVVFNFGVALVVSSLNVYFRDTQHLVGVVTSAWFFLSPVMYDFDFIRDRLPDQPWIADVLLVNPLAVILTGYRCLMLPDVAFPWNVYSVSGLLLGFVFTGLGFLMFKRLEKNFADFV